MEINDGLQLCAALTSRDRQMESSITQCVVVRSTENEKGTAQTNGGRLGLQVRHPLCFFLPCEHCYVLFFMCYKTNYEQEM